MVDILGLGEVVKDWVAIIGHFPQPDEKVDSKEQKMFSGGVTANFCVAAARLGIATGFAGAVGDDVDGDWLIEDFKREGVDTTVCLKKQGMSTGVNFIFVVESSGEKSIIQSPYMQTTKLNVEDIQKFRKYFESAKLLHTTCLHPDITLEAMKIVKAAGGKVSFDLESQIAIRGIEAFKEIFKYVDILLPNKLGAMTLTKAETPEEAAQKFLDMGIKMVVLTKGSDGAMVFEKSDDGYKEYSVPAFKIKPIDTTGAGDTFCAAFLASYVIRRKSIESALKIANAAAAMKCLKLGARTGMPKESELIKFLADHGLDYNKLN
jgi:ribokinase